MKNKTKTNADLELLRKIPISRSKIIVAVALLAVMSLMWLKLVLSNRGDNQATVDAATSEVDQAGGNSKLETVISYVELPFVEGRSDTLKRDIFMTGNWGAFKALKGAVAPSRNGSGNDAARAITDEDIAMIESIIKLDGIIASQNSATCEAFIENKLVSIGSKVAVNYNNRVLELVVTEIHKNKVVLRWKEFKLNVKMPQVD